MCVNNLCSLLAYGLAILVRLLQPWQPLTIVLVICVHFPVFDCASHIAAVTVVLVFSVRKNSNVAYHYRVLVFVKDPFGLHPS